HRDLHSFPTRRSSDLNCLRLLIPKVLLEALWLVTKCRHVTTYGHGRHLLGRKSTSSSHAALEHLPDYLARRCGVASPRPPDRRRDPCTGRNRIMHQQAYALTRTAKQFRF